MTTLDYGSPVYSANTKETFSASVKRPESSKKVVVYRDLLEWKHQLTF